MGFVALVVVVGSVLCALLRTVVLSRHAGRFLAHDVWLYDVGMRYAWLVVGVVALVFLGLRPVALGDWLQLLVLWLLGVGVVWLIPPWLAKFI